VFYEEAIAFSLKYAQRGSLVQIPIKIPQILPFFFRCVGSMK